MNDRMKKKDPKTRGLFAWFTARDKHFMSKKHAFLPADVFDVQLKQERARADRTGSSFVVLTFEVELIESNRSLMQGAQRLLADTLTDELRVCDTKGWHANGPISVAAILPDTTKHDSYAPVRRAGSLFQERFRSAFPNITELPLLRCGIHAYPCEGSWGKRPIGDIDTQIQLKNEIFADVPTMVVPVNGNGHHG